MSPLSPEEDKSFQVDVFASFFAILIIVATIVVSMLGARSPALSAKDSRRLDPASVDFPTRGWRLIFGYSSIWIIRDGEMIRLDTIPLARAMAEGKPLFSGPEADDRSSPIADGLDPGETWLDIRLREKVPEGLIAERLRLDDSSVQNRFVDRSYPGGAGAPYFFVWRDQMQSVSKVFSTLTQNGVPFRWRTVDPKSGKVMAARIRSAFSLEEVLR